MQNNPFCIFFKKFYCKKIELTFPHITNNQTSTMQIRVFITDSLARFTQLSPPIRYGTLLYVGGIVGYNIFGTYCDSKQKLLEFRNKKLRDGLERKIVDDGGKK